MRGFSLVELLTVVSIVGILAAIAIPQFSGYRSKAFDSRSLSDLRNAAEAEEAYFAEFSHFMACANVAACKTLFPSMKMSTGVQLSVSVTAPTGGSADAFSAMTYHPNGTRSTSTFPYVWDSSNGGLQGAR